MKELRIFILVIVICSTGFSTSAQTTATVDVVKVTGEVTTALTLTIGDLQKMKKQEVMLKDHDGKMVAYTGVPVQEILQKAGVPVGPLLKGRNLNKYMLVKCSDNYQVVLTLAEMDSSFTDRPVILAYESGTKPLPVSMGPFRLIVPGEKKQARSSFKVQELVIGSVKE